MMSDSRLVRSESDRMIAGVCGGLGQHFGIDPSVVRIVFVLLAIFGGSGVVLYLVLWLILPRPSGVDLPPRDAVRDSLDEGRQLLQDGADAARRAFGGAAPPPPPPGSPDAEGEAHPGADGQGGS
jgi:phage shock protein C